MKITTKKEAQDAAVVQPKLNNKRRLTRNAGQYYFMVAPTIILILIFSYVPMGGIVMAFQDFKPTKGLLGSEWVGFKHFKMYFESMYFERTIRNTITIAVAKMAITSVLAIAFSIMINEIRIKWMKKSIQTVSYLPHFMSWVILSGIMTNLFNMAGPINQILESLGMEPVSFFGEDKPFRQLVIWSDVWKNFGYSSIIYLAAITAVDPNLHEAAALDGASWWQRVWHVTLPAMLPIIILNLCLNVTGILNAGFDQIYNLYSPLVYESADIIDTYVYRAAMKQQRYSLGTAIGLMKSVIGFVLMISMNEASKKFAKRSVF